MPAKLERYTQFFDIQVWPDVVVRILAVFMMLFVYSSAAACTLYTYMGKVQDPAATMNRADFAFQGKLVASVPMTISDEEHSRLAEIHSSETADRLRAARERDVFLTFEVNHVWKGQVGTPFVVQLIYSRPCASIPQMSIGDEYIIFGQNRADFDTIVQFVAGDHIQATRQVLDRGYK